MADTVKVKAGDTLSAIAKANKTTVAKIVALNPKITNPNLIKPGQVFKLPPTTPKTPPAPKTPDAPLNPVVPEVPIESGTPSPTVDTKQDPLSMSELAAKYGIAAAVLNTDPSLIAALNKIMGVDAAGNKVSGQIVDPALQLAVLQSTDWYTKNSDDYRKYQYYKQTNPATFAADLQKNTNAILDKYKAAGVAISLVDAQKYAEQLMMKSGTVNGKTVIYDDKYLNKLLASSIDFSKKRALADGTVVYDLQGQVEKIAQGLYKIADDYGYQASVSNTGFQTWLEKNVRGLIDGSVAPEDVDNELQSRAISMFPGLAKQIQSGSTLREAADPWITAISSTLEMDSSQVDLNGDLAQKVLNFQNEKGDIVPADLRTAKLIARKDKAYDFTEKAKTEKTNIAQMMMRDMGYLA